MIDKIYIAELSCLDNPNRYYLRAMLMNVYKYNIIGDTLELYYERKSNKNGIIKFLKK